MSIVNDRLLVKLFFRWIVIRVYGKGRKSPYSSTVSGGATKEAKVAWASAK